MPALRLCTQGVLECVRRRNRSPAGRVLPGYGVRGITPVRVRRAAGGTSTGTYPGRRNGRYGEGVRVDAWTGAAALLAPLVLLLLPGFALLAVLRPAAGTMRNLALAPAVSIGAAWLVATTLSVLHLAVTPVALGLPATTALFVVALIAGWLAWSRAVRPVAKAGLHTVEAGAIWRPFKHASFRRLLAVFMFNGIASAVPATLVLFFIQDLLQAPASMEPLFLGSYFLAAALSIPMWLAIVKRLGLAASWLCGMFLAMAVFSWATQIGAGQTGAFLLICALSGIALGTDLALPGALLAGVIQANGDSGQAEGAYFGWWNFATKLNLALAAGLALPLLAVFGYAPGVRAPEALSALVIAYCVLPCVLKLCAAAGLYFFIIRKPESVAA